MKGKSGKTIGSIFLIIVLSAMVIVPALDLINPEYTGSPGRALRAERERLNTRLQILMELTHKNLNSNSTPGHKLSGEDDTSDSNSGHAENPSR